MPNNYLARILEALIWKESSGNPRAVSKAGARGLGQIMPSVLEDYNKEHKTTYTLEDLFNPEVNRKITEWHLTVNIPRQLVKRNVAPTLEAILAAYNVGAEGLVKGRKPPKGYVEDILRRAKVVPPEYTAGTYKW